MKAYIITDEDDGGSIIVFAESRGKAASIAKHTTLCEDRDFTAIRPYRVPQFDKYYRGKSEMDWENPKDRIALVKHGWRCIEPDYQLCRACSASKYCESFLEKEKYNA